MTFSYINLDDFEMSQPVFFIQIATTQVMTEPCEMIEGKRRLVSNSFVTDTKYYSFVKDLTGEVQKLRCSLKSKTGCKGTHYTPSSKTLCEKSPHTCGSTASDIEVLCFSSELKRELKQSNTNLKDHYNEVAAKYSEEARNKYPFEKVQSTLTKIKKALQRPDEQCSICFENWSAPTAIIPCGQVFCSCCLLKVDKCPLCNGPSKENMRIYLSRKYILMIRITCLFFSCSPLSFFSIPSWSRLPARYNLVVSSRRPIFLPGFWGHIPICI